MLKVAYGFFLFGAMSFLTMSHEAWAQKNAGVKPLLHVADDEEESDTETVLEIDQGAVNGFGGVRYGTASVNGKWLPTGGLRGAWLFKRSIMLGFDFTSLLAEYHPFAGTDRESLVQEVRTAALYVGKIYKPNKFMHLTAAMIFGRGFSSFMQGIDGSNVPAELQGLRKYNYLSPEVTLEWNLSKYTRPFLGASLTLPFGGDGNKAIDEKKLLGAYGFFGINIGNF